MRAVSYDAVLFDFDGVLVDSEPVHWQCWREIVQPFGINLEWENYRANCIGVSDGAMLERLCAYRTPPLEVALLWAEYPRKKALFRERMLAADPISSDVRRLLGVLDDYPIGVVTSSGRAEVEPILEASGILARFAVAVYGEDVARHKPAPDPYLLAARRIGAARPLVVEDSEPGIASARAAGFEVVRIGRPSDVASVVRAAMRSAGSVRVSPA